MAKTITTNILINAKQNGLTQIGDTLTTLGSIVDGMSSKLIDLGKGSLDVYKNFEYNMAQAKIALATAYGQGTNALDQTMEQLTEAASQWASTSIFHTDDVSNAIMEAARGGLKLEEIMSTIPAAMELAQAGGVDLSVGLDQLMTTANALGISIEEIPAFADNWAYAANSSMTSIEEMGDAMMKMGATMQFGDSNAEIMTMIGILSDAGTKGEAAGTLLRNSMLRLINPTKKAKEMMMDLGVSEEEMAEALEKLSNRGFSAYENGKLKPMLQTYGELYDILVDINGGAEELQKNEEVASILGAIFPTRSITGALALLQAASNGFELYGNIMENAEGYGEFASETAMNTFVGKEETFFSKWEELQRRIGENLAPQVEDIYGKLGDIIDRISNMDDADFAALVGGLKGIAVIGPGLMLAGTAVKLIGLAVAAPGLTAGALAFGAIAIALGRISELNFQNFKDAFGDMSIDTTQVDQALQAINDEYTAAYKSVSEYNSQLEEAYKTFTSTSGSLSSMLTTKIITGTKLNQKDKDALTKMGDEMGEALMGGVEANYRGMVESIYQTFGGDAAVENPTFKEILDVMAQGYTDEIARAEELSTQLREAMTSAFKGGLSGKEIQDIERIISEMNKLFAQQVNREQAEQEAMILHKAQSTSLESLQEITDMVNEAQEQTIGEIIARQAGDLYDLGVSYDRLIEKGVYSTTDKETALAEMRAYQEAELRNYENKYGGLKARGYMTAFNQNFQGSGEWTDYVDAFARNGGYYATQQDSINLRASDNLIRAAGMFVDAMGGMDKFANYVEWLGESGDVVGMQEYGTYYNAMSTILGQGNNKVDIDTGIYSEIMATLASMQEYGQSLEQVTASTVGQLPNYLDLVSIASASSTYGGFDINDASASADAVTQMINDAVAAANAVVDVEGNTEELEAGIKEQDGQTLTENVTGNTSPLAMAIAQIRAEAQSNPIVIAVTTGANPLVQHANGGRSTVPAIFGEAGPEWAIPEQHTDRTAELLNAARAASGFTWSDLISRTGGNSNATSTTLVYSPTINAGNAQGVEQALIADKARLERWWEDRQTRNAMEVYA